MTLLSDNRIRSSGGNAIWETLKANTTLTCLNVRDLFASSKNILLMSFCLNNKLGDDGVHKISEALNANTTLAELDISSKLLNKFIFSKHLSGNDIGLDGVVYISEGLKENGGLKVLHLNCKKTAQSIV